MFSRLIQPKILCLTLLLAACGTANSDDDLSANKNENATGTQDSRTLLVAGMSAAATAPSAYKGMWSWRDRDINTETGQQKLLNFAVNNKITSIYISAEWLMRDSPAQLAAFINSAASKNIAVELLFASHDWALTGKHQIAVDHVHKANQYIRSLTGARPVALHFDVEPHSLPGWATNKVSYGNQLIDLYTKLANVKDPSIPINADIAMGYRTVSITRKGITKSLTKWVIDATDSTTLMAYRDYASGADSIIFHGNHPINYAVKKGKVTYLGVETNCGLEPEKITFCEEKRTGLNTQLGIVVSQYTNNPGFGGVAIHDYAGFSILP